MSVAKAALALARGVISVVGAADVKNRHVQSLIDLADGAVPSLRIAIASDSGDALNGHFGSCLRFLVYQVSPTEIRLVDIRDTMDAEFAEKFPVLTFASGPTNSMRGAAFLSGVADAIVVDIGGTTSDVGSLHKGFPRQATVAVEVGGVRTNFRMPDVFSIGLGAAFIYGAVSYVTAIHARAQIRRDLKRVALPDF